MPNVLSILNQPLGNLSETFPKVPRFLPSLMLLKAIINFRLMKSHVRSLPSTLHLANSVIALSQWASHQLETSSPIAWDAPSIQLLKENSAALKIAASTDIHCQTSCQKLNVSSKHVMTTTSRSTLEKSNLVPKLFLLVSSSTHPSTASTQHSPILSEASLFRSHKLISEVLWVSPTRFASSLKTSPSSLCHSKIFSRKVNHSSGLQITNLLSKRLAQNFQNPSGSPTLR